VAALRNTRGLTWPTSFEQQKQKAGELDLLDWLRAMFGFQVGLLTKGIKPALYFPNNSISIHYYKRSLCLNSVRFQYA
jgi:hypothetical protein